MEFNTVSISDGITMGAEGMKASLISREVIADSIELVARGNHFDAIVCLSGCDKTNPGVMMALARLDIPGLALYGGSINPGKLGEKSLTIQDVFEAVGAYSAGKISEQEFMDVENFACPGAGACGGQFTANTMSTIMEFIGISPMGFNSIPAMSEEKDRVAFETGKLVMEMLRADLRPSQIYTRKAFENAITSVAATGGSTNAVLHLLALAREANVDLHIDDFDTICSRVPLITDIKPFGKYMAADMHTAGGIPFLMKRLLEGGYLHGDCVTVQARPLPKPHRPVWRLPVSRSSIRWISRSSPMVVSSFCMAICRKRAGCIKPPRTMSNSSRVRRACSSVKRTRCWQSPNKKSSQVTWW